VAAIGAKRGALLAKQNLTPDEEKLLDKYEDELTVAHQGFQKLLSQLEDELKTVQPGSEDVKGVGEVHREPVQGCDMALGPLTGFFVLNQFS
jgi:soluble cytochrome b562